MALLEADVDFSVARDFIATVKDRALGQDVLKGIKPGEQIVKIFHDELTALLGGDAAPLVLDPPARILMVGLNGAGKTTTSAKLALRLKKDGRRPALVACDLYRPAAVEQLATLAREIGVPVYQPAPGSTNVLQCVKDSLKWLETQNVNAVIFDTAGRQEVDDALIAELKSVRDFLNPGEVLLVADAATGQQAVSVARTFDEAVGITGIVLTKLDGDARGGAALSIKSITGVPIKFVGTGEKTGDFDTFYPDRLASRILGMGDVVSLVERAQENIDQKDAERMAEKMRKADFNLEDFLAQMQQIKKMGSMQSIVGMMPGMSGVQLPDDSERQMGKTEAIILSMTLKERRKPDILNGGRRQRIANGAGVRIVEVNQVLKQFQQMQKMMKMMKGGGAKKMMRQMESMKGRGGFPGF